MNVFRSRRGKVLQTQILETAGTLGRDIEILDVGGRADYWQNVGLRGVARVVLLNTSRAEFSGATEGLPREVFEQRIGDARDLSDYANASVDFVHSNSVIEHVGGWNDMAAMASEVSRVGRSGWIQTPALEFPIEPHFHLPFIHWLRPSIRSSALRISPLSAYRRCSAEDRQHVVDSIRLLSKRDLGRLFPEREIYTERLLLPKSYVVRWQIAWPRSLPRSLSRSSGGLNAGKPAARPARDGANAATSEPPA